MAYNITNIGRIAIAHQTTFGTATTAFSSFTPMECEASLPPVAREVFERNAITSGHYRLTPIEGSQHGQEYTLTFPIHGYLATGSSVTTGPTVSTSGAIGHPEAQILKAALGSAHAHTGSYLAAASMVNGSDDKTITVDDDVSTDATGNYAAGAAVGVATTVSGYTGTQVRAGFMTAVTNNGSPTDDVLTLKNVLGGTVAAGENLYGAETIFLDTTVSPQFFTIEWRSLDDTSRVLLDSCHVKTVEITLTPRGVAMMTATFIVNGITATTTGDNTGLGSTSYTLPTLPTAIGNNSTRFLKDDTATAVNSLSLSIESTYAPVLSHSISNGVSGLLCTDRSITCKFEELITAAPVTALDSSPASIFFQIGGTAGNIMAVSIPAPVMYEVGALSDAENTIAQEVTLAVGNYASDTATAGASPDPGNSDFRIAFL